MFTTCIIYASLCVVNMEASDIFVKAFVKLLLLTK